MVLPHPQATNTNMVAMKQATMKLLRNEREAFQ